MRNIDGLRAPLELIMRHVDGDGTNPERCGGGWRDCPLWPGHDQPDEAPPAEWGALDAFWNAALGLDSPRAAFFWGWHKRCFSERIA